MRKPPPKKTKKMPSKVGTPPPRTRKATPIGQGAHVKAEQGNKKRRKKNGDY